MRRRSAAREGRQRRREAGRKAWRRDKRIGGKEGAMRSVRDVTLNALVKLSTVSKTIA